MTPTTSKGKLSLAMAFWVEAEPDPGIGCDSPSQPQNAKSPPPKLPPPQILSSRIRPESACKALIVHDYCVIRALLRVPNKPLLSRH